jgi:hypothetical protein
MGKSSLPNLTDINIVMTTFLYFHFKILCGWNGVSS